MHAGLTGLARATSLALCFIGVFGAAAARAQLSADALMSAIVGLKITVPGDARTAKTLGTDRTGSGIVIDEKGLVLTIGFLLLEADEIEITTSAGKTLPAVPVAYSGETGFGLLRIQGDPGTTPLQLGNSDAVGEGQPVLVAGYGGVSAIRPAFVTDRREFAGPWEYLVDKAIFTTPPHAGFGGAGLVGEDGRLVGIGYLLVGNASGGDTPVPGNMFVPINLLKPILPELVAQGRTAGPTRPWLGLYSSETRGRLFVDRVATDGPAENAGLRPGDIVLGIGGEPVSSMAEFYRKVWAQGPAGSSIPLTVLKGLQVKEVAVTSIDRTKWFKPPRTF